MRKYKIVFIDDEKEIIGQTIKGIETLINVKDGLRLEYEILSDKQSIGKMNDIAADIVLFDCALYATDLDNFGRKTGGRESFFTRVVFRSLDHGAMTLSMKRCCN